MNGGKLTKDLFINKLGNFFKIPDLGLENGTGANNSDRNAIDLNKETYYFTDILPNGDYAVTVEFLQRVMAAIYKHLAKTNDREERILNFKYPNDLKSQLDLEIGKDPLPLDRIIEDCQMAMENAVRTGHPRFFNQISQGLDIVSLAGEWVTAATNTNMFTYEIAPVYNLIEENILNKMRSLIGWETPGDGLFNPGGSISNLYAGLVARYHYFPMTKTQGLYGLPKMTVFTSAHSHYSIHRAMVILGFGLDQIRNVPVDKAGRLIPEKLEEMIKESKNANERPFLVILTEGTTVLGAFDPIEPVVEICKTHGLWLHIDAAWGGGALLSKKHRNLMKGIEKADSVTWNPHKLMGCLLQCSAFLVKKSNVLMPCNEMNASYLFQQDKHYDVCYDTGDRTIQCGRHVDVFKLWLMWRAKGDDGFERQIDKLFDLAQLLYEQIKQRENFEVVLEEPVYTNVCFWYVPNSLKRLDKDSFEYKQKLNKVAPKIKERMMFKGSIMVGYQPLDDKPNFFRAIISNAASREEDIFFMLDEIERLGQDL